MPGITARAIRHLCDAALDRCGWNGAKHLHSSAPRIACVSRVATLNPRTGLSSLIIALGYIESLVIVNLQRS